MIVDSYVSTVLFGFSAFAMAYFLVINGTYLTLTVFAIIHIRQRTELESYEPAGILQSNQFLPGIAIVVPAYNEEKVIVDSVTSLLSLEYPFYEVIVVNDGSTDGTVRRLVSEFELERIDAEYPVELPCEPVDRIYRAPDTDLVLIDKANGGKADALNAGLFFTQQPLFCAIDADSLIERGALQAIVEPFLTKPTATVATGGTVRIANGVSFEKGAPADVALSGSRLVRFQAVEYLRAFFLGRTGLSRIRSLIIISGAFGLFDAETLREIGGYDTDSITEDMELVVRLHRHLIDTGQAYEVTFLPHPVVWTEVPESLAVLSRQRRRWFRGLLDTLVKHRDAIGRPSYGLVGLVALPLFLFIEGIGRLVEALGYVLVPLLFVIGSLDVWFFTAFLFVSVGLGAILSTVAILGEVLTYRRYDDPRDVAVLLGYALFESFSYRPWRALVSCQATFEYLLGDKSWGKMTRTGFDEPTESSD